MKKEFHRIKSGDKRPVRIFQWLTGEMRVRYRVVAREMVRGKWIGGRVVSSQTVRRKPRRKFKLS